MSILLNSTEVAERIKFRSKELNVQLKEVFERSGLNKNMIAGMRNGSMPKADNLAKIAEQLNCSVDYLLGQEEESERAKGFLPERLQEALDGMSCEDYAQKFEGNAKVMSLYLEGKRKPLKATLFQIATELGVNPEWLCGIEGAPKYKKPTPVSEDGLSEAEQSMLKLFRLVPAKDQGMVTQMIEAALRSRGLL